MKNVNNKISKLFRHQKVCVDKSFQPISPFAIIFSDLLKLEKLFDNFQIGLHQLFLYHTWKQ